MGSAGGLPHPIRVKNKSLAAVQITAEQLLLEARQQQEPEIHPPKLEITDSTDLADHRLRKRKEFEDLIRQARCNPSVWVRYARWEESQNDFTRARSIWERALDADPRNPTIWLSYAEVEMRNGSFLHARNIFDRAVALLPRQDQLWYKYIHMEERLGQVPLARLLFDRWMSWEPEQKAWLSYIQFELRYGEVDRVRSIYDRFVARFPQIPSAWIRYAKFEMKNGEVARARAIYERAIDRLAEEEVVEVFIAFAEFAVLRNELDLARCIYKYTLDRIPEGRGGELHRKLIAFEKQFGDRERIEDAIVSSRRFHYENEIHKNPLDYDTWFDYIRLEQENYGSREKIREVYERAVANVPPAGVKRYWQRYIYLWINYALYEELDAEDVDRTRHVYRECLKLIPHQNFSFAKIWLLAAQFEIRQKNLKAARQILGNAIGMASKEKIFKCYIELELQLGNLDRCRTLYQKYLEWAPANCYAWSKYAQLEKSLFEIDRAREIFEIAIAQPALDMPDLIWKAYIDFESSECEFEKTRQLYERFLDRTKHFKVWIDYGRFEASCALEDEIRDKKVRPMEAENHQCLERVERCRNVFKRALECFRSVAPHLEEERTMLLEEWLKIKSKFGCLGDASLVQKKFPRKVKRRRPTSLEDGTPSGYEEYMDYAFPEEVAMAPNLKILEAAYMWKRQKDSINFVGES